MQRVARTKGMLVCPHCSVGHDHVVPVAGKGVPAPGDLSLCLDCGEYSLYREDGTTRKLTSGEVFQYSMAPGYSLMARAQVLVKLRRQFGDVPGVIIGVKVGKGGEIREVSRLPPESLDQFL